MAGKVWTCGACKYEWPQSTGAVPASAACPSCGAEVAEVAKVIEAAKPAEAPNA